MNRGPVIRLVIICCLLITINTVKLTQKNDCYNSHLMYICHKDPSTNPSDFTQSNWRDVSNLGKHQLGLPMSSAWREGHMTRPRVVVASARRWTHWHPDLPPAAAGDDSNTLRPRQYGCHFPDNIFKCIFFNENEQILMKVSLKFVPWGPINNIPASVEIMAWRQAIIWTNDG